MGEVVLGGGSIEMDTDATDAAMNALGAAGSDLNGTWSARLAQINALESQLGKGPLGRPFAEAYNANAVQLVRDTELNLGAPERAAASGRVCVRKYLRAEAAITQSYQI